MKILIKEFPRWIYWYPFRLIAENIPLKYTYPLVKLTARLLIVIPQGKIRRIEEGLKKSFPEKSPKEIQKLTYKTFENYLLNACEAFWYPKLNKNRMKEMVDYEGLEKIDEALKKGKGIILAHGHFGNEELLMPAIGYMGYKAHQLASRWEPEACEGLFGGIVNKIRFQAYRKRIGYRETFPVTFHYIDKSPRSAIECLKRNEVLLFAVDGREGTHFEKIPFLSRIAYFSPGVVKIARMTGAVILPVFITRQPDCRHKLTVHNPIELNPKNDMEVMNEFFDILSSYIKLNPEQYAKVYFLVKDIFQN